MKLDITTVQSMTGARLSGLVEEFLIGDGGDRFAVHLHGAYTLAEMRCIAEDLEEADRALAGRKVKRVYREWAMKQDDQSDYARMLQWRIDRAREPGRMRPVDSLGLDMADYLAGSAPGCGYRVGY